MATKTVSAKELSEFLDLTERHVQRLAKEEVLPKANRGKYPFKESVVTYINYLRETAKNNDYREQKARLTKAQAEAAEIDLAKRSSAGLVIASWHSTRSAKRNLVRVGSGEPVHRIRKLFQSEESAKAAANAEYSKRQRQGTTLTFEMAGRNDMIAEAPLKLIDFRKDVPVDWLIKSVEHTLDLSNGWKMNVQAELPDII